MSSKRICAQCEKQINPGDTLLEVSDKQYHQQCFNCDQCHTPIQGTFYPHGDGGHGRLCQQCKAKQMPSDVCAICAQKASIEDSVTQENKVYHKNCFRCIDCSKRIEPGVSFRIHAESGGKPQCKQCGEKNFDNLCEICKKKILSDARYMRSEEKYWHMECFKCSKCHQVITDGKFIESGSGKIICGSGCKQ